MVSNNNLLLRALKLNAMFSGFSAICLIVAGNWLAVQLALENAMPIYLVAGCLAMFALLLANIVRTKNIRTWEITGIIIGDIAWVVASVVLVVLFYKSITTTALVLVDLVAIVVLFFAVMQIRGLKQYRTTR